MGSAFARSKARHTAAIECVYMVIPEFPSNQRARKLPTDLAFLVGGLTCVFNASRAEQQLEYTGGRAAAGIHRGHGASGSPAPARLRPPTAGV
jgi:hypothetical protein